GSDYRVASSGPQEIGGDYRVTGSSPQESGTDCWYDVAFAMSWTGAEKEDDLTKGTACGPRLDAQSRVIGLKVKEYRCDRIQQRFKELGLLRENKRKGLVKKLYGGSKSLCPKCNYHHDGPCAPKCHKCNRVGHLARDCRSPANANTDNNQRGTRTGQKPTCYECGAQGHFKRECPKLKNNNQLKQTQLEMLIASRQCCDLRFWLITSFGTRRGYFQKRHSDSYGHFESKLFAIGLTTAQWTRRKHEDTLGSSGIGLTKEKLYAKFSKCEFWIPKGDKKEAAFQLLKQKLCSAPILALPEGSNDFVVHCDASHKGLGVVLITYTLPFPQESYNTFLNQGAEYEAASLLELLSDRLCDPFHPRKRMLLLMLGAGWSGG
ncbi:reverse transcriptase domain-containing protein, partial [Tanacetum coccineum]